MLTRTREEIEAHEARICEALLKVGTALPARKLEKILDRVLETSGPAVYDALGRGPIDHLEPVLGAPLRKQSARPVSPYSAGDVYAVFLAASLRANQLAAAATLARKLTRGIDHMGRLVQTLRKLEPPPEVLPIARSVVQKHEPTDFLDDFPLVYGLVGVLAMDGTPGSARAAAAFSRKALAQAGAGDNPADRLAYVLGEVGRGKEIAALVRSLQQVERKRAKESEAQAWATGLSLPMKSKPDWRVDIWLAEGKPNTWFGMMQEGPQVHLLVSPSRAPYWTVELMDVDGRGCFCRAGVFGSNDFGLPKLRKLEEFPRWLIRVEKKLQISFAVDKAAIGCGRSKSAIAPIRRWLAGE